MRGKPLSRRRVSKVEKAMVNMKTRGKNDQTSDTNGKQNSKKKIR
jgi:hypothetical protein